ncbi:MAG: choice-of-anchor D domain-containing protein [Acidobacteriaceae bacterium]
MSKFALTSAAAFVLVVCELALPSSHAQQPIPHQDASAARATAAEQTAQKMFNGLPLLFEKNAGQSDPNVDYVTRANGFDIFLTSQQAVLVGHTSGKRSYALQMRWLGSNASPAVTGQDQATARSNYFIGDDSSKWHTGIANYARVQYAAIYPGIDLVYYGNHERLEYDLTLAPGADAHAIRLQLAGAKKLSIDKPTGDLLINDGGGELRFRKPLIYQPDGNAKHPVTGGYVLSAHNTVSFSLGDYDHNKPLVIDPQVVYSTMYGGSIAGTYDAQTFYGMAVDAQGDVYLQGIVTTPNLPTTTGSFQPACNQYAAGQCSNFFVAKFDPTKSGAASLIYATYIGGNEEKVSIYNVDSAYYQVNDIAADSTGDAYFAGSSSVANYPTTTNAYSQSCVVVSTQACYGAAVFTKLDPTGSTLLYSTYIPETYDQLEVSPGGIAIDGSQIAYIEGVAAQDLSTTDGSTCVGCNDAPFVAAIDTTKSGTASLLYAEFLPLGAITALAADSAGNLYLGGEHYQNTLTWSGTVQTIPLNGFQTTTTNTAGIGPTFVRLNHAGVSTYSTYIGSGSTFGITAIATDPNGIAYAGGNITGPVTQVNGLPSTSSYSGYDAFIAKIDTTQTGSASLLYSTYLTGSVSYAATVYGLAANGTGQVAFTGGTTNTLTFPEVNPLTQPVAVPAYTSTAGPFIGILDTTKTGAAALTFLSLVDGVQLSESIAFDPNNNLIIGGFGNAGSVADPFLSVPASYQTSVGTLNNPPFFYKIGLGSTSTLSVSPSMLPFGNQVLNTTSASQPVTVTNSGPTAITFTSIVASSPFAETDNCSSSLAANSSCTINVTFTPTATTGATGTLTLTDSDSSSPQTVTLSGTGIAGTPKATLSPMTLPFGDQTINISSSGMGVTLSNPGTATLTNIALSITGTNPTDFSETNNCSATLDAGSSCSINVVFDPSATGASSATLSVADNVTGSPQAVALTGTGTAAAAPVVTLSPNPVAFGNQTTGTTSTATAVTLSNTGNASLTITSITIGGANPSDFAKTTTCGSTLAAGSSCTILVTFTPASAASFAATLSVADNAASSPQSTSLTGTGTVAAAPVTALSPNPVAFASQTTGTTSTATAVKLSNTGNAPLTISSIGITGTNPIDFAETTTCGTSLAAGSNCTISITFTPASAASFAATLSVADNATSSPQTVALTGTGTAPAPPADFSIAATPGMQSIAVGAAATYTVTVSPVDGSFTNAITLSVTGLPTGATASFAPASVTPGDSAAPSTLIVQTATTQAMNRGGTPPGSPGVPASELASAFALFLLVRLRRTRKLGRDLLLSLGMLAILGATLNLSGCNGGFGVTTPAQTYTLTITGTSGSDSHSTTVQLTVN